MAAEIARLVEAGRRGEARIGDRVAPGGGDWKSNHLGSRPENYGPEALAAAMGDGLYVLQYHLYAVALHEYLKSRVKDYDYDRHFGGAFYVFLRGVDPSAGPETGIFRDRPARGLMESREGLVARAWQGF